MSSQQKYKNNYTNGNSTNKKYCRSVLMQYLKDIAPDKVKAVTLPCKNFELERDLSQEWGYKLSLHCCEKKKKTFKEQIPMISTIQSKTHHYNTNVFDLRVNEDLNFIWFDLCGYLVEREFSKFSEFFFRNKFEKRGIFAITTLCNRENIGAQAFFHRLEKEYLDSTKSFNLRQFRVESLPQILKIHCEEMTGNVFTCIKNYSYVPDTGKGRMTMYVFQWQAF